MKQTRKKKDEDGQSVDSDEGSEQTVSLAIPGLSL